jgi:hypothetical protein
MAAMLRVNDQYHEAAPAVIAEREARRKARQGDGPSPSTEILLNIKKH